MKRIVSLLLTLVILMPALISCGNGDGKDTTSATTTAAQDSTAPAETTGDTAPELPKEDYTAYLFAYFIGNWPEAERIHYAVSSDGYHFTPLNNGNPILQSRSGTGCVRDPYIFKGHDGAYYMIGTDMRSEWGWDSNRNLISWRSEDLVNWTDETIIKIDGEYETTEGTLRAWAPQAIWNEERQEYMIYFALKSDYTRGRTVMYYAYSPDLKTLSTEPAELFAPTDGCDAIDADIIYDNGIYYMFFKNESSGGIHLARSRKMDGGYSYVDSVLVSRPGLAVEGSSTYKLIDGSGWLMIADAYGSGFFTMTYADTLGDFLDGNFTELKEGEDFEFSNFTPRHGSIIPITNEQYKALMKAY